MSRPRASRAGDVAGDHAPTFTGDFPVEFDQIVNTSERASPVSEKREGVSLDADLLERNVKERAAVGVALTCARRVIDGAIERVEESGHALKVLDQRRGRRSNSATSMSTRRGSNSNDIHNYLGSAIVVYMSGVLTTAQVARRLGVHASRVRALIAAGRLTATRAGEQWLIDADSVDRHADLMAAGATGRPFAARTAWAAAAMCDGLSSGLNAAERYRLRNRLAHARDTSTSCQTVQRWLSLRAQAVHRYRIGASDAHDLLASGEVLPTGISAADAYGLGLASGGAADAYVSAGTARRLVADFFLIDSPQGNLTLRVLDFDVVAATQIADSAAHAGTFTVRAAPRLIAGADLADDTDARTHSAGCALINDALRATMWA